MMNVISEIKKIVFNTLWIFSVVSSILFVGHVARAAVVGVKMVRPQAFFLKDQQGLFESLDLKKKTYTFTARDVQACRQSLKNQGNGLSFTCTIGLSGRLMKNSKLHEQSSPQAVAVRLAQTSKNVRIATSSDARSITLSVDFDSSGVDGDWMKMNDDMAMVYQKTAQDFFSEALLQNRLVLLVLEN
jgi:hypothetical protein